MGYNFYSLREGVYSHRSIAGRLFAAGLAVMFAIAIAVTASSSAQPTGSYSLDGGATEEFDGVHLVSNAGVPGSSIVFEVAPGTLVNDLTNLEANLVATEGTCGGGSPRFAVSTSSGNVFVYIGDLPNYTSCADGSTGNLLTTGESRVDTGQVGGTFYDTWEDALTLVGNEEVTEIILAVDGGWLADQEFVLSSATINAVPYDFVVPVAATSKDECKNGGWKNFQTAYKNQGQCVASVVSSENSAVRGRN